MARYRAAGRSPECILTHLLVNGVNTQTAGCIVRLPPLPPTARRLPHKVAAVDFLSGVSGRVFHTDVVVGCWMGETALSMSIATSA